MDTGDGGQVRNKEQIVEQLYGFRFLHFMISFLVLFLVGRFLLGMLNIKLLTVRGSLCSIIMLLTLEWISYPKKQFSFPLLLILLDTARPLSANSITE